MDLSKAYEMSSAIALFVEHPVCSSFRMYAILIIFLKFLFRNYLLRENV